MCLKSIKKPVLKQFVIFCSTVVWIIFPRTLLAARMPWDDSLMVIEQSLTGTTAHILIIIAIAMSGLMWAIGDHGSIIQKAGKIIFGGSIATGAVSICSALKLFGG